MGLRLFNTLTRQLDEFKPVKGKIVRMYNCGPTVYSHIHIGNFRAYVFADILRRYLEYKGLEVRQVVNITDVGHLTSDDDEGEDKMLVAAKKEKKDPYEISKFYTEKFMEDIKKLNIQPAYKYPRATGHVKEMIEINKALEEKGFAYFKGGNLYFDTSKFDGYGKLSKFDLEALREGRRVCEDPNKKSFNDFVLWFTKSKFTGHMMQWDSPWGKGYPGWHIECSAMAMKYLSTAFDGGKFDADKFETIDIHTGGEDNMFPHHECEIAQTEAATGKKFSNFWMHVKFLIVEGKKMSKSLGNFYVLSDLEKYDPLEVRYVLFGTHYRQQLNFTFDGLDAARKSLGRLRGFMARLDEMNGDDEFDAEPYVKKFEDAMDDDLNVSAALAAVFEMMKEVNKLNLKDGSNVKGAMLKFDKVLALDLGVSSSLDADVEEKIKAREKARAEKDWATADKIRDEIKALGVILEDSETGTRWTKIK
ncbi:MAG: cysteine--tRNA ligase [Nanoarchaeota archaeon]|nr:cysteine--tRNA ligase [Nanoarchaeota archaeon]